MKYKGKNKQGQEIRKSKNVTILPLDPDARSAAHVNSLDPDDIKHDIDKFEKRKELNERHQRQIFAPGLTKEMTKRQNEYSIKQNQVTPGHWLTKNKITKTK